MRLFVLAISLAWLLMVYPAHSDSRSSSSHQLDREEQNQQSVDISPHANQGNSNVNTNMSLPQPLSALSPRAFPPFFPHLGHAGAFLKVFRRHSFTHWMQHKFDPKLNNPLNQHPPPRLPNAANHHGYLPGLGYLGIAYADDACSPEWAIVTLQSQLQQVVRADTEFQAGCATLPDLSEGHSVALSIYHFPPAQGPRRLEPIWGRMYEDENCAGAVQELRMVKGGVDQCFRWGEQEVNWRSPPRRRMDRGGGFRSFRVWWGRRNADRETDWRLPEHFRR